VTSAYEACFRFLKASRKLLDDFGRDKTQACEMHLNWPVFTQIWQISSQPR
jgi:hypothetical protein